MTQQIESIKSMVQDLRNVKESLHEVDRKSRSLETSRDRSKFLASMGTIQLAIISLQYDLWDLEPTLSEDLDFRLKPSLDEIDLSDVIEDLLSNEAEIREDTIGELQSYMLEETADQLARFYESGTGYDFALTWWQQQPKPFSPVVRVYKQLRHKRRFLRYLSAKVLEEKFGVKIWDSDRNEPSLKVANRWFGDWLNNDRNYHTVPYRNGFIEFVRNDKDYKCFKITGIFTAIEAFEVDTHIDSDYNRLLLYAQSLFDWLVDHPEQRDYYSEHQDNSSFFYYPGSNNCTSFSAVRPMCEVPYIVYLEGPLEFLLLVALPEPEAKAVGWLEAELLLEYRDDFGLVIDALEDYFGIDQLYP